MIIYKIQLLIVLSLICLHNFASITKASYNHNEELETVVIYHNLEGIIADRSYNYLESAGISDHSFVEEDISNALSKSKEFQKNSFGFLSDHHISKAQSLKWFLDFIKMISLHVYDDPNDIKLAAGPQVDQQLCGFQLDYMLHMINKRNKHITNSTDWSIFNMINSFGSPTMGIASANTLFLGDYEACTSYKLSITKKELVQVNKMQAEQFFKNNQQKTSDSTRLGTLLKFFKTYIGPFIGYVETVYDSYDVIEKYRDQIALQPTVYCLAGLRWPSWPNSTYHKRNVAFRVGVCLPDTCDSSSLDLYNDKIKRLMNIQIPDYYSGYYINNLYCLPDERSPLRNPLRYSSSVLFIVFNVVWVGLLLSATIIVHLKSRKEKYQVKQVNGNAFKSRFIYNETSLFAYLKCWCVISNFNTFIGGEKGLELNFKENGEENEKRKRNEVNLSSLDGLKVIGFFAVASSHFFLANSPRCWNNLVFGKKLSSSIVTALMPLTATAVNIFFVITGVITSIKLLQLPKQTLMKPAFWFSFFIHRYLRIVPLYLFVHWATHSYFRFLNKGPLWDYATSKTAGLKRCNLASTFEVIIPMANFKSPKDHCIPVGWYLANDLQFSLITPLFIILFLKKPLVGHITVLITSIILSINHINYYANLLPETNGYLNFALFWTHVVYDGAPGYVQPQYRCLSYFIGLSAGHVLIQYSRGKIKRLPNWFISFGKIYMCLVLYIMFIAGFARFTSLNKNKPLLHFLGAIYAGSSHWFSSTSIATLILLLCTGNISSSLLNQNYLKVLSGSLLSPILIHIHVAFYRVSSEQHLTHLTIYSIATKIILDMFASIFFGSILHILYELPMKRFLIRILMKLTGQNGHSNQTKSKSD